MTRRGRGSDWPPSQERIASGAACNLSLRPSDEGTTGERDGRAGQDTPRVVGHGARERSVLLLCSSESRHSQKHRKRNCKSPSHEITPFRDVQKILGDGIRSMIFLTLHE